MAKFRVERLNTWMNDWVTDLGASPKARFRSGPPKASTTATSIGLLLCTMTLPTAPFTTAANGIITKTGTWAGNAAAPGVVGHCEIYNNAESTCHWVGSVTQAVGYSLTAGAAAFTTVLTIADTSGVTVGAGVLGAGVPDGAIVQSKTSTTLTLSVPLAAAMLSGDTIVVGNVTGDMVISGAYIANTGDPISVLSWAYGWPTLF